MVTIEDTIWVAANNMDAGKDKVGRRSIKVIPSTVNFQGSHLSILTEPLVHWTKTAALHPSSTIQPIPDEDYRRVMI